MSLTALRTVLSGVQTAFSDTYLGYTSTLASFLSLEFSRLNHVEKRPTVQVPPPSIHAEKMLGDVQTENSVLQTEEEELKLLSLLLAPVTRIHSYLSHIQVSRHLLCTRSLQRFFISEEQKQIHLRQRIKSSKFHGFCFLTEHCEAVSVKLFFLKVRSDLEDQVL